MISSDLDQTVTQENSFEAQRASLPVRIARNTIFLMTGQAIALISTALTGIIIARSYGQAIYGQYALAFVFVTTFGVLFNLGSDPLVVRRTSEDTIKAYEVFSDGLWLRLIAFLPALLVIWICAYALGYAFEQQILIILAGLIFGLSAIADLPRLIFQGLQRMQYDMFSRGIEKLSMLTIVAVSVIVLQTQQITQVLIGMLFGCVIGFIVSYATLYLRHGALPLRSPRFSSQLIKVSLPLAGSVALITIAMQLPAIILSRYYPINQVGLYTAAYNLIAPFILIPVAFSTALLPVLTGLLRADRSAAAHTHSKLVVINLAVSLPLMAIFQWIGDDLLSLMFGGEFRQAFQVLKALSWYIPASFLSLYLYYALIALKEQKRLVRVNVVNLVVTVAIGLYLIYKYGATGAAYTISIATFAAAAVMFYELSRKVAFKPDVWLLVLVVSAAILFGLGSMTVIGPKYLRISTAIIGYLAFFLTSYLVVGRKTMKKLLVSIIAVCLTIGCLAEPIKAMAQETEPVVQSLVQFDLNSDGLPDLTTWDSTLDNSGIKLSVYDGGGDMQNSGDWSIATDFINDTWLFDCLVDDKVDLAIRFSHPAPDQYIASIWDDQSGDGEVSINEIGGELVIEESNFASLTVQSHGYWTQPDGRVSANLIFNYDGVAPNMGFNTYTIFDQIEDLFGIDGNQDYQIKVVDQDQDGIVDFVHNQIQADVPTDYGVWRNTLKVNPVKLREIQFGSPFFWPLLNYIPIYARGNYFSSPPFVLVDWTKGKINDFGITGYPVEAGYHVVNFNAWSPEIINQANFENTMAYYDLAENHDGLPELHIRHVYWPPGDIYFYQPSTPLNELRYSWRLKSSELMSWDYSLSLAGSHPIDSTIDFDGYRVQIVPYQELPTWGIDKKWGNATFQAVEAGQYYSTEGIYEWSTSEGVIVDVSLAAGDPKRTVKNSREFESDCFSGGAKCDLSPYMTDIAAGLRGEYAFLDNDVARLYYSPIDRRLHLRGANLGLWRLDPDTVIELEDISGDGFLDLWRLKRDDRVISTLIWTPSSLIFAKEQQILIKKASLPISEFETPPPTDHAQWQALNERLLPGANNQPGSLQSMFDQFEGELTSIQGAEISAVHNRPGGIRFNLKILPGFAISDASLATLGGLAPGDYQVNYTDNWDIQPLVPLLPSLSINNIESDIPASTRPNTIKIVVSNAGLQDYPNLKLVIEMMQNGQTTELARKSIDAYPDEREQVYIAWQPTHSGFWTLRARLEDLSGQTLASAETDSYISSIEPQALQISAPLPVLLIASMVLCCFVSFLIYIFSLTRRLT